jgi:hypothetical protein
VSDLVVISRAELAQLVCDAVREVVGPEVERAVARAMGARLVDVAEAARLAGTTKAGMHKRVSRGSVPTVRHGRRTLIRVADLLGETTERADAAE